MTMEQLERLLYMLIYQLLQLKNEARKVDKEDEEKNVDVELEENKTEENNVKENVDTEEAEEIKNRRAR